LATATLTSTPTLLDNAESTTNWNGDSFSLEPDIKVQGSNSVACTQTNSGNNDVYVDGFTPADLSTVHLRLWFNISYVGYLSSTNPCQVFISDGTNTAYWDYDISDYGGGWRQAIIYTGNTPLSGTKPTGNTTQVGIRFVTSSKPRNVPANAWFDAWYYGDGYTVTGGTSGDEIDWSHIAAQDKVAAYGICTEIDGVYFLSGDIKIGNGSSTTYFSTNGQICVFKDLAVNSSLYNIEFVDSVSGLTNIDINGGAINAGGSQDYTFNASDSDINTFSISGVQFSNSGSVTFYSDATVSNCVFDNCGQVVPTTCSFSNITFANYTGTDGALLFPSNDSNISSITFINCDNGVEYDATSDSTSPSFNAFIFDDVSGKYDVNNTSGSAVTISKNNGSNPNSYNPGGSSVTFAGASVTTKIIVKDSAAGSIISGARVLVHVTDNSNYFYQATPTSITGSGTTATVSHTSHGLSTGDYVLVFGVTNDDAYNGVWQVTVSDSNTYTYTTTQTITSSPATGTIELTMVVISGTTDGNGEISDTRQWGSDQLVGGWVRKSTSSPYYQQGVINGTISTTAGLTQIVLLVKDE